MRPGPGLSLYRHLPAQQPCGGQRHPARFPVRQRGPGGPPGRLHARPSSAMPTRGSIPAPRPGPTTPGCRPTRGSRPASTWGSTFPTSRTRGGRGSSELGYDVPGDGDGGSGHRARPPGRARRIRVPERRGHRLAGAPGRPVVRPRQLLAPAPALRRGRAVVAARTTPTRRSPRCRRRRGAMPFCGRLAARPAPADEGRLRAAAGPVLRA